MRIEAALTKFITQLEADGRSPHTIGQYRRHIRLFAHWAREVGLCGEMAKVGHEHIARFLASPHARTSATGGPKKPTSINTMRSSLKCFFSYLHRAGYIRQDPGRLIRRARCGTPPPRALSDDEAKRLMATMAEADGWEAERDHCLFHLMLASGIRLGSAVALDIEDVDLDGGTIRLRTTKNDHPDQVFLGKEIRQHLRRFIGDRHAGPLFCVRNAGRISIRQVQRRFERWLEKADIRRPASVHSLRHSMATRLYRRTGDIFLVKEALRHRSIMSTLVYTETSGERLQSVLTRDRPPLSGRRSGVSRFAGR